MTDDTTSSELTARDHVLIEPVAQDDDHPDGDDLCDVVLGDVEFSEYRLLVASLGQASAKAAVASQQAPSGDDRSEAFGDYKSMTELLLALLTARPEWGRRMVVDEDSLVEARLPDDVEDALGIEKVGSEYVRASENDAVDIPIGGGDE